MQLSKDGSGWSIVPDVVGQRKVYVSNSGDDGNDGLSDSTPKLTIAAGKALIRNGYADQLLLNRGDTFNVPIGQWKTAGPSATEPQLIGAYGTGARPKIRPTNSDAILTLNAGGSAAAIDNLAIIDLDLAPGGSFTGGQQISALAALLKMRNVLIEGCLIQGWETGIRCTNYGGSHANWTVRRNVIVDSVNSTMETSGHGVYFAGIDGVLFEENLIDSICVANPSIFRHGAYFQGGTSAATNVVCTGNIISNVASDGIKLRGGGVADNNLFLRNPIALVFGGGTDASEYTAGGVDATAWGNVILDGRDLDAANLRGWGCSMSNIRSGLVRHNLVANNGNAGFPIAWNLSASNRDHVGVRNVDYDHNYISGWGDGISLSGSNALRADGLHAFHQVAIRNSDVNTVGAVLRSEFRNAIAGIDTSACRFYSTANAEAWIEAGPLTATLARFQLLYGDTTSAEYDPDAVYTTPDVGIGDYAESLMLTATHAAFITACRAQAKGNWDDDLTAASANEFIRAAFGLVVP